MCYDSSDRNYCLASFDSGQVDGDYEYYGRDVSDRITYRQHQTITNGNWVSDAEYWYGYTGDSDGSSFIRNANWDIIEKTLQLPGGVMMTIKPQQTGNAQKQYSLPSALGRTLLTTDASGTNTSNGNGPLNSFTYDPFGNILPGSNHPDNAAGGSYGFGGTNQKLTATSIALAPIQMGARVYLASIGRFTQMDPVPGGNANDYVYALDPINFSDYSGMCLQCAAGASFYQPAVSTQRRVAPAARFHPAAGVTRVQRYYSVPIVLRVVHSSPKKQTRNNSTRMPKAKVVSAKNITTIKGGTLSRFGPASPLDVGLNTFSELNGLNAAMNYYKVGSTGGAFLACTAGGIATALSGGWGCLMLGPIGYTIGGTAAAIYGFFAGGYGKSSAEYFEYGPDAAPDPGIFRR
jgi:RHS repeat-associated protein